ncbi:MAG: hypothetical protein ACYTFT_15090 [Planctomycetota bacterium]|jgi:hypothetical protein
MEHTHTITTGAATEDTAQDLEDRIRLTEEKVRRDAGDIVDVLKVDLPAFIERQTRERYTAAPPSFQLDRDALTQVKADVRAAGEEAIAAILPALEGDEPWFGVEGAAPTADRRRDLTANAAVNEQIQRVGGFLKQVLVKHGFPGADAESFDDVYKLPTWFIAGHLLVSCVESYWRNVEGLLALKAARQQSAAQDVKSQRASDWDSA